MKKNKTIYFVLILIAISVIFFMLYKNKGDSQHLQSPHIITTLTPTIAVIHFTQAQLQEYYLSYEDPYVIALRTALDGYLDGTNKGMDDPQLVIKADKREGYIDGLSSFSKNYYKSKFIVYAIEDSLAGGKQIAIIFQDYPDKMFDAWIYKTADNNYYLRGFSQNLNITSSKMKIIQLQYKTILEDKKHSM